MILGRRGRTRPRASRSKRNCIVVLGACLTAYCHATLADAQEGVIGGTINPSGLQLEIRRFAQVPDFAGQRARTNALTYSGLSGDTTLYITDEGPSSRIYQVDSELGGVATLFFDVDAAVFAATGRHVDDGDGNFIASVHYGVRSLAFHPDFASNGRFYTAIMEDRPADITGHTYLSNPTNPLDADTVLVEWTYDHGSGQVDTGSYREVFRVGVPHNEHTIRQIGFNPLAESGDEDYGLLYIAHGDSSQQSATAGGGQNSDALGKILRINPLQSGASPYSVPATNPFVEDASMIDEVYTLGHRNPHNFAFASDTNGETQIVLTEIGRDNVDEINLLVAGGNYGWAEREGTFVHLAGGGNVVGVDPLPANEADFGYIFPAAQYGHDAPAGSGFVGRALTGGYVIAGGSLQGEFLFSEFGNFGRVFHVSLDELANTTTQLDNEDPLRDHPDELSQVTIQELGILFDHDNNPLTPSLETSLQNVISGEPSYNNSGRYDIRFGQGPDGTIYILNKNNGWIYEAIDTASTTLGDFNNDGLVDGNDFLVWQRNPAIGSLGEWQASYGIPSLETMTASATIPEPSSILLMISVLVYAADARFSRNC